MRKEPKNPARMTEEERMALPGWDEYEAAIKVPKKTRVRGFRKDDLYAFVGTDGVWYNPTYYDGAWYKL